MSVTSHAFLWLAGLATVGAAFNPTQDPAQKPDPNKRPPPAQTTPPPPAVSASHISLDDLMGGEVLFDGAGGAASDKAKKDDAKKGKVKDLVLASDGRIAAFAVHGGEIGDRTILVRPANVTCNIVDKKPSYMLRMSKADLDAQPDFDAKKAEKEGLDRDVERLGGSPKVDPGEPGVAPEKNTAPTTGAMAYALGSQLKGCEINASDKHFGKVRDAAVDSNCKAVSYLLVSHGGVGAVGDTVYVVPFGAARWVREDDKSVLKLAKSSDELKTAPEYKKPEHGFINADQMRGADAFWGGKRPMTPPN